ncbi:MAG: YciI family protein [Bacteroidota bacterium]|nr:YciI family protein [Bacteroidota bacterium]
MKKIFFFIALLTALQSFAQDSTNAKPKEYLAVLTLTEKYQDDKNWTKADQGVVSEHFQRLIKMKNEGIVVFAGRTQLESNDPNMMGLVVFYAKDQKEALQFMLEDPAVKNKIMLTKVYPYGTAINKCD